MIVYKQQVALLLQVLPEVAKEKCFALHGGTAINLFVRNMPRLSVDIDLTYTCNLPIFLACIECDSFPYQKKLSRDNMQSFYNLK